MQYGLISDIHGNLEALEAVLKEFEKHNLDEILCLGDIIGYGPDPIKCVELVRKHARVTLAGNHDYAPIGLVDTTYFNNYARKAVDWTAARLSDEVRDFLKNLPLKSDFDSFTIAHATPANPSAWDYILSIDDAIENFPHFQTQCCFIGHSHVPLMVVRNKDGGVHVERATRIQLAQDARYIINIGSVGQPRDLDPRAACAIFNSKTSQYELVRVNYEIGKTQRKILERGLPPFLAERIALGQ